LLFRRFFCDNAICKRETFAEQFLALLPAYARRTQRLAHQQRQVGLSVGGQGGARLLGSTPMPTSGDTVLRLVKASVQAVWLLFKQPETLKLKKKTALEQMLDASPVLRPAYNDAVSQHVGRFQRILCRQRKARDSEGQAAKGRAGTHQLAYCALWLSPGGWVDMLDKRVVYLKPYPPFVTLFRMDGLEEKKDGCFYITA
jgi:hypothetical protein